MGANSATPNSKPSDLTRGDANMMKLFKTEDGGYDPDKWYVTSMDDTGQTRQVRIAIAPRLYAEMERIVQSGQVPAYSTVAAMFRDAIVHRLRYLADHLDNAHLHEVVNHAIRQADMQRQVDEVAYNREYIESVRDGLRLAQDELDDVAMERIAMTAWASTFDMRDPYQTELRKVCKQYVRFEIEDVGSWDTTHVADIAMENASFREHYARINYHEATGAAGGYDPTAPMPSFTIEDDGAVVDQASGTVVDLGVNDWLPGEKMRRLKAGPKGGASLTDLFATSDEI